MPFTSVITPFKTSAIHKRYNSIYNQIGVQLCSCSSKPPNHPTSCSASHPYLLQALHAPAGKSEYLPSTLSVNEKTTLIKLRVLLMENRLYNQLKIRDFTFLPITCRVLYIYIHTSQVVTVAGFLPEETRV